jgi:hypothetical protein
MRRICLTASLAIALALPTASSAAAPVSILVLGGAQSRATFSLSGSNGYSIQLDGSGRSVTLTASGNEGSASYTVRGRPSPNSITARFGNRGRIAVKFKQTEGERRRRPPARCKGRPRITRFGVFIGMIRFRGEHGFTEVDADRARGNIYTTPRWKCKRSHGGDKFTVPNHGPGSEKETELEASMPDHHLLFSVYSARPPEESATTLFLVQAQENRGSMDVSRAAFALGRERDFKFDEADLASATVQPPSPFAGSATFLRGPNGSTSWTGSLKVSLPGAPSLALAGPRFKARLFEPPFARWPRLSS